MTDNEQTQQTPEIQDLHTVGDFFKALNAWHSHKVAILEHMLEIPDGSEVTFPGIGEKVLSGDMRDGFIVGVALSLIELGKLPFVVEFEAEAKPDNVTAH